MDAREKTMKFAKHESELLREFLGILKEEKSSISSFSLENILECNNQKEEALKKLGEAGFERQKSFSAMGEKERHELTNSENWGIIVNETYRLTKEIASLIDSNLKMLTRAMRETSESIANISNLLAERRIG